LKQFKGKFPTPLSIAFFLTATVFILGVQYKFSAGSTLTQSVKDMTIAWYNGLWDNSSGGLYFAFQMMLVLVLGHVLAQTTFFKNFITSLTQFCTTSENAALTISITAIILGYINWGLALVLSALLVKQVLLKFEKTNTKVNVGLLGAAAYTSMLVWHGGLSGSSPTKASEKNALHEMMSQAGYNVNSNIPEYVSTSDTLFSEVNIFVFFSTLIVLPLVLFFLGRKSKNNEINVSIETKTFEDSTKFKFNITTLLGISILTISIFLASHALSKSENFLNVNFINLSLLGMCILLHNNLDKFSNSVQHAIQDASGILIQFPIYFGIIGLMKESGLSLWISQSMVEFASAENFTILSFLSAGLLNFFIPSGGGQFYIQGPILIQSAVELNVSIPKTIMALSYGDQWTNMLQPFWALPLLGITKIKLVELLPYCLALFLASGFIFSIGLYFF